MTEKRSDTRIQDLFAAALELEPAQRELFVRNAAGGESDVVHEVLELLGHDARAGEFMATPLATAEIARDVGHPARIGNYAIERVLGEGGMGVVYLARQENPNRLVALKVLRATSVAPRALRRFEQETRVLGRLHHPGIAAIHEA